MSKRYIFSGVILPERAKSGVAKGISLEAPIGTGRVLITFNAEHATISIVVDDEASGFGVETLKNAMEDLAHAFVDALGFVNFAAYDVEIRSAILPDGRMQVFGVGYEPLEQAALPVLRASGMSAEDIARLTVSDAPARFAIADLREAIRVPVDTGFHCFRAIECVRQFFIDKTLRGDRQRENSWLKLREALRVDRDYFPPLEAHGLPRRHGAVLETKPEERTNLLVSAWHVVFRYLVLRHKKLTALPDDQDRYPVLKAQEQSSSSGESLHPPNL